ncbi:Protein RecA [Morella rubra]|uniref:Protein RecA n=1 Tax=Morella rubra TaxID=262757 RepID=A0A6A1VC09_9ROSI|nr:Protein RecA [Morella rubra]
MSPRASNTRTEVRKKAYKIGVDADDEARWRRKDNLVENFVILGYCVFVDAEHALDPTLAQAIGVKIDKLLLSHPDCGEQALSLVDTLIRSGSVDVVVVDRVSQALSASLF